MKYIFISFLLVASLSARAEDNLNQILNYVKGICDEIDIKGSMSRSEIKGIIQSDVGTISKLIGAKIGVDGKIAVENMKYEGIPYHDLPAQISDSRQCKKELALAFMETRQRVVSSSNQVIQVAQYEVVRKGMPIYLMSKPDINSFLDLKPNSLKIKELIEGTKIRLTGQEYMEDSKQFKPLTTTWKKIEIISGENKGFSGWIPLQNIKQS